MSARSPKLSAVPASRSKLPILKIRLYLVIGVLGLSSLMGMFSTVAWILNKPQAVDTSSNVPYGKGLAELTVNSWLDGVGIYANQLDNVDIRNSKALPHGKVVWDSFTRKSLPAPSNLLYEVHTFMTTIESLDTDGNAVSAATYISVAVAFPGSGEAYIASMPSFRKIPVAESSAVFDYTDLSSLSVPNNANKQVKAWASAFAEDDRDQLKLLSGDTIEGYQYLGMGGFKVGSVVVESAMNSGNTTYGADTWLVRVRINLISADLFNQDTEMDLTIVNGSSGLPKIIGYGPAGSGLMSEAETRVRL